MLSLPDNKDWLLIAVIDGYTEFVILVCILPTFLILTFEVAYRSVMLADYIVSLSASFLETIKLTQQYTILAEFNFVQQYSAIVCNDVVVPLRF